MSDWKYQREGAHLAAWINTLIHGQHVWWQAGLITLCLGGCWRPFLSQKRTALLPPLFYVFYVWFDICERRPVLRMSTCVGMCARTLLHALLWQVPSTEIIIIPFSFWLHVKTQSSIHINETRKSWLYIINKVNLFYSALMDDWGIRVKKQNGQK